MQKPIEVICWTDFDGTVHPIRMRMTDEYGEKVVINLSKLFWKEERRSLGKNYLVYSFKCIINEVQKTVQICFCKETLKWTLIRITD